MERLYSASFANKRQQENHKQFEAPRLAPGLERKSFCHADLLLLFPAGVTVRYLHASYAVERVEDGLSGSRPELMSEDVMKSNTASWLPANTLWFGNRRLGAGQYSSSSRMFSVVFKSADLAVGPTVSIYLLHESEGESPLKRVTGGQFAQCSKRGKKQVYSLLVLWEVHNVGHICTSFMYPLACIPTASSS